MRLFTVTLEMDDVEGESPERAVENFIGWIRTNGLENLDYWTIDDEGTSSLVVSSTESKDN